MRNFFEQTYHRRSVRLEGYDYSQAGVYFVTVCTQNRECLFGDVIDDKMTLNVSGKIAAECLNEISEHFSNVELDEFAVMPNHIHAILVIVDDDRRGTARRGTACRAPTNIEQFGKPVSGSIPTIIRSHKSAVTKRMNHVRGTRGAPIWQRNYYEHIVRNEEELQRICEYITSNPARWFDDENNPARETSTAHVS